MSSDPRSWPDKALGASLTVLAAAIALDVAIEVIKSVWLILVLIVGAVSLVGGVVKLIRRRSQGW